MKIKEVSKKFGLTADTLRYYERLGLIHDVPRNAYGIREYTEENCANIAFIKCMRAANVSIEGLTEYMHLYLQGKDHTRDARKAILVRERECLKERIEAMSQALDLLDHKIKTYNDWEDKKKK